MKNYYSRLLLLSALFFFPYFAHSRESVSLNELINSGKISVSFQSKGGYQGDCMQMIIQNMTADSVIGFIEPGRRLNSINDSEQDILVVKAAQIQLRKFEKDTLDVIGFCCQSHNSGPTKGALYAVGALAPAAWLFISNLINGNNFSNDAIQHAIWVLSDNHDIRSIPAYSSPAMDQLRHAVAKILDIELPWYSFLYKTDSTNLFSGTKTHFFAEVAFNLPIRAMIRPEVTNTNGQIIYTGNPEYFKAGDNIISIKIPIEKWPESEYDLHLIEDFHTTNKKIRFDLGE